MLQPAPPWSGRIVVAPGAEGDLALVLTPTQSSRAWAEAAEGQGVSTIAYNKSLRRQFRVAQILELNLISKFQ
jgi:hypothetical protein